MSGRVMTITLNVSHERMEKEGCKREDIVDALRDAAEASEFIGFGKANNGNVRGAHRCLAYCIRYAIGNMTVE